MTSHKQKYWRKVLSVSFLPIVCGLYFTKTTHSHTNTTSYIDGNIITLAELNNGQLSLLTYNVAGLPDFLSAAVNSRAKSMKEISQKINHFDIVNVQEDFHYHHELYESGNNHRYRTEHKVAVPYGDGLNTFSKYPIQETRRIPWQHCNGSDCLAAKGFSFSRIVVAKDVSIDVYNIHATAQDDNKAAHARKRNIEQLADYINTHSTENAVIVMGDFNAHFAAAWDNLPWFVDQTQVKDVWVTLMKNGTSPLPYQTFIPNDKLTLTDTCESIDKIFFRNSAVIKFTPKKYKVEKQYFTDRDNIPLSDHYAISCVLQWEIK